jgi:hypothetical protein
MADGHPAKPSDKPTAAEQSRRVDIRILWVCIDSADLAKIASFWESALGWRRTSEPDDEVVLEPLRAALSMALDLTCSF